MEHFDIAVVGGGLAGIACATANAKCGKRVVLYEKEAQLGGRIAGWTVTVDGRERDMQHGYHAVFPEYTACRALLEEAGVRLIEEEEYVIYDGLRKFAFATVRGSWLHKARAMHRQGMFRLSDTRSWRLARFILDCVYYNERAVRRRYGTGTFASFCKAARIPTTLERLLRGVSRTLFSTSETLPMTTMILATHIYLFKAYDGLRPLTFSDAHGPALSRPLEQLCKRLGVHVCTETAITDIVPEAGGFVVRTDVKAVACSKHIVLALPDPHTICPLVPERDAQSFHTNVRIWCTARVLIELPIVFTTCGTMELDFVFLCHKRERDAAKWASEDELRAVLELHSYSSYSSCDDVVETLLEEVEMYLHITRVHHKEIVRGRNVHRQPVNAPHGITLVGDWTYGGSALLMEAAVRSGYDARV